MKRFLALSMSALVLCSALTACGGAANNAANTSEETTTEAAKADGAESKDAAKDEAKDDAKSEAKAEPKESSDEFTFADLQDNYAILCAVYGIVEAAYEDKTIAADAEIEQNLADAAALIEEIGQIQESDFSSQDDLIAMNDNLVDICRALGAIADKFELAETPAESEEAAEGEEVEGEAVEEGAEEGAKEGAELDLSELQANTAALTEVYGQVEEDFNNGVFAPDEEQAALMQEVQEYMNALDQSEPPQSQEEVDEYSAQIAKYIEAVSAVYQSYQA